MLSSATRDVLSTPVPVAALPAQRVKGRETPVMAFKVIDPRAITTVPAVTAIVDRSGVGKSI